MSVMDEGLVVRAIRRRHGLASELAGAAGILTRLPVRNAADSVGGGAFGLVGAAVGAAGGLVVIALGTVAPSIAAIGAVAVMAALSGALHLDGLADTADALVAPTEEAAERARSDPRAGPAAVAAIVVVLFADWSIIGALIPRGGVIAAAAAVVIAGAASRAAAVLAPSNLPGRFRTGFGSWFADRVTGRDGLLSIATAMAVAAILAVIAARPGLALAGIAGLAGGSLWCLALARIRRGLDGDALGALVELTFTTTLLVAALAT
jgi:adenosylcobinamide-GDP ribazoletransferase